MGLFNASYQDEPSQKKNSCLRRLRTEEVQNTSSSPTFAFGRATYRQNDSRRRNETRDGYERPPRHGMYNPVNRQQVRQANRYSMLYPPRKSRLQRIQRTNGRRSRKRIHSSPPIPTPTPLLQASIRSGPVRTQRRPISPLLVARRP